MVVGEFTQETQLVVIGGGPGGYAAAFRAAELGVETVIVDANENLGGVCLHQGCIPSKTLLNIAQTIRDAEMASNYGVQFGKPDIDIAAVGAWVNQCVSKLASGLAHLFKKCGVEHIQGEAVFEDSRRIAVRNSAIPRVRFRRAIIATGSVPKQHPALPVDGQIVLDPRQALRIERVPASLLVLGNNYNAVEIAQIYAAFGSRVSLVTDANRMLCNADADLTRPLVAQLKKQLANLSLNTGIADAAISDSGIDVTFTGDNAPADTHFDQAIVSIGYDANVAGLELSRTGVTCDEHGFIITDDQQRTGDARILAVGDVTGGTLLADRALSQGRVAAEVVAGWNSRIDDRAVPVAVFADPQIAWCGLTEQQAKQQDIPYRVIKQPWGASGRAVGLGRTDGMSKIIYDPDTQLILGVGIAGTNAAELIGEGALAIEMGAVLADIAITSHPHPTLSEMFSDAAQRAEQFDA